MLDLLIPWPCCAQEESYELLKAWYAKRRDALESVEVRLCVALNAAGEAWACAGRVSEFR